MNKELNPLTYLVLMKVETKSNAGGTSGSASDVNIDVLNTATTNTPTGQNLQTSYENAKASGWVGTAADYAKEYAQTPQGKETLNWVGSMLAPLLGNQQTPEMSNAGINASAKYKGVGLSPTTWIIIAVASVAILAGVGIAIYKYTK